MKHTTLRGLLLSIISIIAFSHGFQAWPSTLIGTVVLKMTGHIAKNSPTGPWVYSEPLGSQASNDYVTYTIYDDKILDENGSVYTCVYQGERFGGLSTAMYRVDDTTYLLRIGTELMVVMEENDNVFFMELGGRGGSQTILSHHHLNTARNQTAQSQGQSSQSSGWQQLADALGRLGNDLNRSLSNSSVSRQGSSRQTKPSNRQTQSSQTASDEWVPTHVLEIYSGLNIRTSHQFHNWYKHFYGNRWCLFLHKGGTQFHVATPNNDRTRDGYDVSSYRFKAIAPTGLSATGTRYYYFN